MTTKIGLDIKAIAPFSFDGHGINDVNGQRITKVTSCDPYIYPDGQAVRNAEFDRLSTLFAAAPELLEALEECVKDSFTAADGMSESGKQSYAGKRYVQALTAIRKARSE